MVAHIAAVGKFIIASFLHYYVGNPHNFLGEVGKIAGKLPSPKAISHEKGAKKGAN